MAQYLDLKGRGINLQETQVSRAAVRMALHHLTPLYCPAPSVQAHAQAKFNMLR